MFRGLRVKKVSLLLGMILIVFISALGFTLIRQQIVSQNKAMIWKLYKMDPEICESLVREMFDGENTETQQELGEKALLAMGYTRQGMEYWYQENEFGRIYQTSIVVQVFVLLGGCVIFSSLEQPRKEEEERLIKDIGQSMSEKRQLRAAEYKVCNKALVFEITKLLGMLQAKESELEKKRQDTQNFVENIAHQIKTPLTCASISLDLLAEQLTESKQTEYVSQSFLYLKEIEILMKKILDIGRMEAGKLFMKKQAMQLGELLEECVVFLDPEKKRFLLEIEKEKECMQEYFGDYEWLKEAFSNILKNSMEHDKSEKTVQIKLVQRKENAFIQIRDHGPGIDEEDLKHIFDRFYLPQRAKKTHTGIGLNLTELVIKKHFGMIEVHNHEDGGVVFSIMLPTYGMKNEKLGFS